MIKSIYEIEIRPINLSVNYLFLVRLGRKSLRLKYDIDVHKLDALVKLKTISDIPEICVPLTKQANYLEVQYL